MRFVRAPTAASSGNGDAELAREVVDAEVRAVGAQLLGRDGQLDRLEQRVRRGTHLRVRRLRPMAERQEPDLLHTPILRADRRPTAIPRGGASRMAARPRSTFAQRSAAPGHVASPVRLAYASTARAGYAAASVCAADRTTSRMAVVLRTMSNRPTRVPSSSGSAASASAFSARPADLLFHAPKLALEVSVRDRFVRNRVGKHDVDHAADRPVHRDLRLRAPPRMQHVEQCLAHRDLEPVAD